MPQKPTATLRVLGFGAYFFPKHVLPGQDLIGNATLRTLRMPRETQVTIVTRMPSFYPFPPPMRRRMHPYRSYFRFIRIFFSVQRTWFSA